MSESITDIAGSEFHIFSESGFNIEPERYGYYINSEPFWEMWYPSTWSPERLQQEIDKTNADLKPAYDEYFSKMAELDMERERTDWLMWVVLIVIALLASVFIAWLSQWPAILVIVTIVMGIIAAKL